MSFVYAEKVGKSIAIYCDTKITSGSGNSSLFSPKMQELVYRYGIVKTTIICPEIAISYAGSISKASKLFRVLYKKNRFYTVGGNAIESNDVLR